MQATYKTAIFKSRILFLVKRTLIRFYFINLVLDNSAMKKLFARIPEKVPENLKSLIKSIPEEIANMVSHAVGLLCFLIALPLLIQRVQGSDRALIGCIIFGISLFMVYCSSTIYHSVYKLEIKRKLRFFDHMAIYFLIAGSFTPFILIHLRTTLGYTVLFALWLMVLIGSVFKYFFTHKFNVVSTLAYVSMGAMAFFIIKPLSVQIEASSLNWLAVGGASYLIGVIFYLRKTLYMNHFIWHIFVLAGSLSHFIAIWQLF
ncbi:MAG: hemolysin III [Arcticibacterium sp.]